MPDTIQADVPEEAANPIPTQEAPASQRDQDLASIVANRQTAMQRGKPLGLEDPGDQGKPEVPENVELKVNGQTVTKTKQEVEDAGGVAAIQKQLAGEEKLRLAAQANADITRQRAALAQEQERLRQEREAWNAQVATTKKQIDESDLTERARKFREGLYSGDDAVAEQAIVDLLKSQAAGTPQPVDHNKLTADAVQQVRWQMDRETGVQEFEAKFKHLNDNPRIRNLVNDETVVIMRENPSWSPRQVIMEAGARIEADLFPAQGNIVEQRNKAKAQMEQTPQASVRAQGPPAVKPMTKSQIVNDIRSSRPGQ